MSDAGWASSQTTAHPSQQGFPQQISGSNLCPVLATPEDRVRGTGQSVWGKRAVTLANPEFFTRDQVLTMTFFSPALKRKWWKGRNPLCKGLFLDFCIGAVHKGVRSILGQERYIILSVDEAPCSWAQLERAISKLNGKSGPPALLLGYCSLESCKD